MPSQAADLPRAGPYSLFFQYHPRWRFFILNNIYLKSSYRLTSLLHHNHIDALNVDVNKSIGEMISHGCIAFLCNVMQTIQGSV